MASELEQLFDELEVKFTFAGYKSSEGDGRTSADIERERAQKDEDTDDGAE